MDAKCLSQEGTAHRDKYHPVQSKNKLSYIFSANASEKWLFMKVSQYMQFYHHLPCTKAMQRRCVSVYRGRLLGVALPRIPKHCPAGMSTARISTLRSAQLLTFIALHCPE